MLGRVLFALVCAVIAAGLVLPLYPSDVEPSRSAALDSMLPVDGSRTAACEECPVPDAGSADCQSDCQCSHLLPATFVAVDDWFSLSVIVVVHPRPAGPSFVRQPLPPRLPAI